MKRRSVGPIDGSARRVCSLRAPRPRPTSSSLRNSDAHFMRPLSTGLSNVSTRLETPPVEVMITTMTICGCSGRTSMWRIVAVSSGGAETIARRFVTCESVSVVTRIASSTSRRVSASSIALARRPRRGQQAIDEVAVARVGRDATRGRVRVREQAVLLEHRELVAHGRGPGAELGVGGERARRHGLDGRLVGEHDLAQDELLAWRQHRLGLYERPAGL